jgi:hypothetical protein
VIHDFPPRVKRGLHPPEHRHQLLVRVIVRLTLGEVPLASALANSDLLAAVNAIGHLERGGVRHVIAWRSVASEELGAIYESSSLLTLRGDVRLLPADRFDRDVRSLLTEVRPSDARTPVQRGLFGPSEAREQPVPYGARKEVVGERHEPAPVLAELSPASAEHSTSSSTAS